MEKKVIRHFANEVKSELPPFLQEIVTNTTSDAEADMMLMGALTTLSATLPNVYGTYDHNIVHPNLYLFVIAKASAGKGHLGMCKELVKPIHKALQSNTLTADQSLLIPANSSATAMYQQLWINNGNGLIFETEADTLNYAIKSNYGNFSDGLRKAFHHETISYLRRKENEWIEIEEPHLSMVLSGTPRQSRRLIPNAENGLLSRFAILHLTNKSTWRDVFSDDELAYREKYKALGNRLFEFYKRLRCHDQQIEFKLNPTQKEQFNLHFNKIHEQMIEEENFTATIRRMGVITYRIAMILSTMRYESCKALPTSIECSSADFQTALTISESLLEHAMLHYSTLPEATSSNNHIERKQLLKEALLHMMPEQFSRKEMVTISESLNISSRTVDNYIREYLDEKQIETITFGVFKKQKGAA